MSAVIQPSPCWVILGADGEPWPGDLFMDGDGTRHYATREKAEESIGEYRDEAVRDSREAADLADLHPGQLPAPCVTLACDICEYVYDQDEDGVLHFTEHAEAEAVRQDIRWVFDGEGRLHCDGDDCRIVLDAPPEPIPGQLDLLTGEEATR